MKLSKLCLGLALTAGAVVAQAADWPEWGGAPARNMVSPEKNIPFDIDPGKVAAGSDHIDMSTTKNVKWVAKMGSQTYGNPTVANGHVYVGTNNDSRNDPRFQGDYSLLRSIDEKTGKFEWALTVPKLGAGKVNDWEYLGITSSPTIEGDKVYIVTNRCDVLCLDANGLKNGNQGYQKEAEYMAGLDNANAKAVTINNDEDADILWAYDMRQELNSFPHNATSSSPLIIGDLVFVATSNGVDWGHISIPSPKTPSLIALKKDTEDPNGELAGEEVSAIGTRIFHGGWSSPGYSAKFNQVVYTGPDGILYGFDAKPQADKEGPVLKETWRFDANPAKYRYRFDKDGNPMKDEHGKLIPIKYPKPDGPSEFICTPVVVNGRIYAAIGQDPEHGEGIGRILCLDIAKLQGDASPYHVSDDMTQIVKKDSPALLWSNEKINRAISTCAVYEDMVFVADFSGYVYCFDANTGELYWRHDTMSHIWGSPLVVDGKVFIGNEDGDLNIYAADKGKLRTKPGKDGDGKNEPTKLATVNFGDAIYSTPVAANNTLYIATGTQLYAISQGGK